MNGTTDDKRPGAPPRTPPSSVQTRREHVSARGAIRVYTVSSRHRGNCQGIQGALRSCHNHDWVTFSGAVER